MDRLAQELRIAFRGLRRTPTFAVPAVLILGLGIGMAVAMVTIYDAVLLKKLPVADENRIVVMWPYRGEMVEMSPGWKSIKAPVSDLKSLRGVAAIAHWGAGMSPLTDGDRSLELNRTLVTGNFFEVLGVRPALGRLLRPEDDVAGAPHVMVLSYRAWQQRFGRDPSVVGHKLVDEFGLVGYTVVGVAPAGLDYPSGVDCWIPPWSDGLSMNVVARLAPGVTIAAARSEFLATVSAVHPDWHYAGASASTLPQVVVGNVRPALIVLTGAVALLLVIACVNVGNLLLLRGATRARELSIRRALGAKPADIIRQLMIENGMLAAAGGLLGLGLGSALLGALIAFSPTRLPRMDVVQLEGAPFAVAVGVTLVTVLLFGLAPAITTAKSNGAPSSLRLDARSGSETTRRRSARQVLVAAQVALALVMLAGAGLLVRSLAAIEHIDLGYTPDKLSLFSISLPSAKYANPARLVALGDELATRWRALPGITSVTPILIPPFYGANLFQGQVEVRGRVRPDTGADPLVPVEAGGPDYFRTFAIPIIRGRGILETDRADAPYVAVVSERVARRFWPNEDPIGKQIKYWGPDTAQWRTVVGIAGDIRFRSLREATSTIYLSWRQSYWQGNFAVRSGAAFATLVPAMQRAAREVDPQVDLFDTRTMVARLDVPLAQPRLNAFLLAGFGFVALLLAAIGLYGVMASAVRDQTREIGVRMALGATPERVRREVLGRAIGVIGAGAVLGIVGALAASRLLRALLYQVSPTDPVALVGACLALVAVGIGAAYLPARRATRIDPAQALRTE